MGKKTKEHRKKVAARNQRILSERNKFEKEYRKMIETKTEELKEKFNQVVQEGINEKQTESEIEDAVVVDENNEPVKED
jgi:hypothetical protein